MTVSTGYGHGIGRLCCISVAWAGFAVISAVLVLQTSTAPIPFLPPIRDVQHGEPAAALTQANNVKCTYPNAAQQHRDAPPAAAGNQLVPSTSSDGRQTWPVSRHLQCGDGWQSRYAAMHAAMLRGELPPRYLVVEGIAGLADSLVGAVSMLYLAVLQRRAFFMTFGGPQQYEWAFSAPHINWTWDARWGDAHNTTHMLLHSRSDKARLQKSLRHVALKDVRKLGMRYVALHVKSMAGSSMRLLDNPHHKDELWRRGVQPTTAFACGVDFLLRIRPQALASHSAALRALSDHRALKIGIQIRTGDDVLVEGRASNPTLAQYDAFFSCAKQLEANRRRTTKQRVLYYLITDSVRLRQVAAEALGPMLVTSLDVPVQHSRLERGVESKLRRGFEAAAAEVWLFSLTNYQIITLHSGFGRLGAYMSGQFHQVYDIDFVQNQKSPPSCRTCSPYNYASMEYSTPESTGLGATGL